MKGHQSQILNCIEKKPAALKCNSRSTKLTGNKMVSLFIIPCAGFSLLLFPNDIQEAGKSTVRHRFENT